MATYLTLDDAAKQLGIPTEVLTDLRSQGKVRGFRDGSSWKFPDTEIERLKEELPNMSGIGSGILAMDGGGSKSGPIIGGDDDELSIGDPIGDEGGSGSDLELGLELPKSAGDSDVNLIPQDGSDVTIVPGGSSGIKGDSDAPSSSAPIALDDLDLGGSAISHDSGEIDMASGISGQDEAKQRPIEASDDSDEFQLGSALDLAGDSGEISLSGEEPTPGPMKIESDLDGLELSSGSSGDALTDDSDPSLDLGQISNDEQASSLELMEDLDLKDSASSVGSRSSAGGDVLSELDLLAGEADGSALVMGDSANLLGSSLMSVESGGSSGVDDALADDDDLIIADDDDDLIVSSAGSDISIAGDSGINLMSPSDSGLSLESEPLDLAGSSISALDLGAELSGVGSGTGSGGASSVSDAGLVPADVGGSGVDFQADEEFQLSPSGIQLEGTEESASQVIAIEESESVEVEEVQFGDEADPFGGVDAFADGVAFGGVEGVDEGGVVAGSLDDPQALEAEGGMDESPMELDTSRPVSPATAGSFGGYEVPFTLFQTIGLLLILSVMSLGGMLMTDLIRNMWSYAEPSAPVSSLTDMLIDAAGWGR